MAETGIGARAEANRIIVKLKQAGNDTLIKYLPSKYHYAGVPSAPWVYLGPFLKNSKGLRAFAFHHNPIAPYVDMGTPVLAAVEKPGQLVVTWNQLPKATGYLLERLSEDDKAVPHERWHIAGTRTEFSDLTARQGNRYTYRIRGYNEKNESAISAPVTLTKTGSDEILGEEKRPASTVSVFPNPARDFVTITSEAAPVSEVRLFSNDGRLLRQETCGQYKVMFSLAPCMPGIYHLEIRQGQRTIRKKVLVL